MTSLDDFAASHADCANRLTELEATVRLLEEENARLKVDLGAAAFVASERTRNSIANWLDLLSAEVCTGVLAEQVRNCHDIDNPSAAGPF